MLGGSFEIESAPGGPTTLAVTLPRWEPLDPASAR
jgi:signal transduction histidine kinase